MSRMLEWLFDLDYVRLGEDSMVSLDWAGPLDAWVAACLAIVGCLLIAYAYRPTHVRPRRRTLLACLRMLAFLLVLLIIAQPVLVQPNDRIEPATVAILLDTSSSMGRRDVQSASGLPNNDSRFELARNALIANNSAALRDLVSSQNVRLYTFDESLVPRLSIHNLDDVDQLIAAIDQAKPTGLSTRIFSALMDILGPDNPQRLSAVLLVSDGQETGLGRLEEVAELASARRVPVHVLPVGSTAKVVDISITKPDVVRRAFAGDKVAVTATIKSSGLTESTPVSVDLIDLSTNTLVESLQVTLSPPDTSESPVEFQLTADKIGLAEYQIAAQALPTELDDQNNTQSFQIETIDKEARVLLVEGSPRYEFRYAKNALFRNPTIRLDVLLLEADEAFVKQRSEFVSRFPETSEQLAEYDVVLLGDVDPRSGFMTTRQMDMLVSFVNDGGGFGLIAGQRYSPHQLANTPLGKLIPVRLDSSFSRNNQTQATPEFRPALTPEGQAASLFRFAPTRSQSSNIAMKLPELHWFAPTLGPKPGARVLAIHPAAKAVSGPMPLFVSGRYGSGRLFFQATDDTWRWRRHTGEQLHDKYWVRVVRELINQDDFDADSRFLVSSDAPSYVLGEAVSIELRVFDSSVLRSMAKSVDMLLLNSEDTPVRRFSATRETSTSNTYRATFFPNTPGQYTVVADLHQVTQDGPTPRAPFEIVADDVESHQYEANHELLNRIARSTGGQTIAPTELATLFSEIEDRSLRVPDDTTEPLWDSKLPLLLFVAILSLEWWIRKRSNLR